MSSRSATVLLVDDDPVMLELLQECLPHANWRFLGAESGAAGLAACQNEAVDLVLLDLGLPDLNGFEVLQRLKADPKTQTIPVLVLTAHSDSEGIVRGFGLGAADYVTKPFSPRVLQARVDAILRGKWLMDQLREARLEAERMARMKSDFLAHMSHEMHTPLNGVIGMMDLLFATNLNPEQTGIARTIRMSGERLLTVVQSALDLLKLEQGSLQLEHLPFALRPLLTETLSLWEGPVGLRQVPIRVQVASDLPERLLGDQGRLRLVLNQLLGLAHRFAQEGELHFRADLLRESVPADPRRPTLEFSISLTDAGGQVDEFLRAFGASGRGAPGPNSPPADPAALAAAKLVEFMGGRLLAEAQGPTGCACHLVLPCEAVPAPTPPPTHAAASPPVPARGGAEDPLATRLPARILLVDDDALNRRVGSRILERLGYKADLATSARQAIERIRQAPYDIVITDIMMPDMNGVEAAQHYRAADETAAHTRARPLFIVAMTANAMGGDRDVYLEAGLDDYVAKPVRPSTLQEVLEAWGRQGASAAAPAAAIPSEPEVPEAEILDVERLNDFAGDDPEMLSETVKLYLEDAAARMAALGRAAAAAQVEEIRRGAHTLVGSSATMGAIALVPTLQKLEAMGKAGQVTDAPACHALAERQFAQLSRALAQRAGLKM